jgi:hypothetical protein
LQGIGLHIFLFLAVFDFKGSHHFTILLIITKLILIVNKSDLLELQAPLEQLINHLIEVSHQLFGVGVQVIVGQVVV